MSGAWSIASWKSKPNPQHIDYAAPAVVEAALATIRRAAPLVAAPRIDLLREALARAQAGDGFLLQAGDCAERFSDCHGVAVRRRLLLLLEAARVIHARSNSRVVIAARMAGQYAKPRSSRFEVRHGVQLPSYFGDLYNDVDFSPASRRPDGWRLLFAYRCAARTLTLARTLRGSAPLAWEELVTGRGPVEGSDEELDCFTSHEGLNLPYEAAQTHEIGRAGHYNLSTHLPWIGERTRRLDGAHVEFFRGIRNPIAVKLGPTVTPDELVELLAVLNPTDEPGRLILVTRMGAAEVERALPRLIAAVERVRARVLWVSDPMHGNTCTTASGLKTRRFADILAELEASFAIHRRHGTWLGGVHLEVTADEVAECIGPPTDVSEEDLGRRYRSACDPRLSHRQTLLVAAQSGDWLRPGGSQSKGETT